jgi:hypothetical protein
MLMTDLGGAMYIQYILQKNEKNIQKLSVGLEGIGGHCNFFMWLSPHNQIIFLYDRKWHDHLRPTSPVEMWVRSSSQVVGGWVTLSLETPGQVSPQSGSSTPQGATAHSPLLIYRSERKGSAPYISFLLFFFGSTGVWTRSSQLLGRCSTLELCPQPFIALVSFG